MALDQNNSYEFAGKGAKRRMRERLTPDDKKPPHNKREKKVAKQPQYQKPEHAPRQEPLHVTPKGLKAKIRQLTLANASFSEVYALLQKANYPGSGVLVSALRNDVLDVIKLLIEEGVLDPERLDAYREEQRKARGGGKV